MINKTKQHFEWVKENSKNHFEMGICFQHCQRHILVCFVLFLLFFRATLFIGLLLKVSLIKEAKSDSNYDNHEVFSVFIVHRLLCAPVFHSSPIPLCRFRWNSEYAGHASIFVCVCVLYPNVQRFNSIYWKYARSNEIRDGFWM